MIPKIINALSIFLLLPLIISCQVHDKNDNDLINEKLIDARSTMSYNKRVEIADTLKTFMGDFNHDSIIDTIYVYKNIHTNDVFIKEHFKLPIGIAISEENGNFNYELNDKLVFRSNNACVSEGFSTIKIKDNSFTIEGQTCMNHWVLIHYYATFLYKKKGFILFRYHEKYFDKAHHDKVIPSNTWTKEDFGELNFAQVHEDDFLNLRNRSSKKNKHQIIKK